ncbi:MAG: RNA polymerase factor sigma-54 [Candidatus Omnitrophica bacterium]|nr:RNA polymerase factor sigma-54 [Candidatus Omnitrophota bacterium]
MKQKLEMRRLMAPELRQSLNILALHLLDLGQLVEQEIISNPFLEETQQEQTASPLPISQEDIDRFSSEAPRGKIDQKDTSFAEILTKKVSLHDILLRQLGMFANTDEELKIGAEIIGNIDDNGYLRSTVEELSAAMSLPAEKIESVLKLIQRFEPAGVGARNIPESLLIQMDLFNENDPLLREIITAHLDDVAKKNFSRIAKALKVPLERIETSIKKLTKLNPKPGRNYSLDEAQRIVPDIIIEEKDDKLEITINKEYIPRLSINKVYRDMLKKDNLDPKTREFLTNKLRNALELLKAISKRQSTLRRVVETLVEIQRSAILEDLSSISPLTFNEVAKRLSLHESTICRVVMNKYVLTPCGVIAMKDFFSSGVRTQEGPSLSSTHVKRIIKELIDGEDKKHPLSDQDILKILLKENGLTLARRTVAKYREELKILSSTFRKER